MEKYRFKTEAEFKADDEWDNGYNHPIGWCVSMNSYLGQDVPRKYNEYCDKTNGFTDDGWWFANTNYVLKEKVCLFEIGKWYEVKWSNSGQEKTYIKPKSIDLESNTLRGASVWFHSSKGNYRDSEYYSILKLKLIKELSPEEINPYLPASEKIDVSKKEEPTKETQYIGKYVKIVGGYGQIIGQKLCSLDSYEFVVSNEEGWEIDFTHISDYGIDPSFKGKKAWYATRHPSEVLDSIPDEPKIEKPIESQFKYSIGDEVQINRNSKYELQGMSEGKLLKGKVISIMQSGNYKYTVEWLEKKKKYFYNDEDLEPYKSSVETPEEPKEKISEQPKYSRGRIEIPQIQVKKRLIF